MDGGQRRGGISWQRLFAVGIGGLAIAGSVFGSVSTIIAPARAFERIALGLPGPLAFGGVLVLGVDIVLLVSVGALIAIRLSSNAVGWLLLGSGILLALAVASQGYLLAEATSGTGFTPIGRISAWATNTAWVPAFAFLAAALLVFPSGTPPARDWSRIFIAVLGFSLALSALHAVKPGSLVLTMGVDNPFGVGLIGAIPEEVLRLGPFAVVVLTLIGAGSMVARYQSGSEVERLQLKWVVASSALLAATFFVLALREPWDGVSDLILFTVFAALPLTIGIAIFRYRLYAIDVIVRRTLTYGVLTVTLGGTYVLVVVLIQAALGSFAGQDRLAIAGATLVVAAAFRPLRDRLQVAIDRRFYRVRYDASRTTAALARRLRHEVSLDVIEADLLATVADAVKPTRAGLWRRPIRPRIGLPLPDHTMGPDRLM
jgi:hypothetical protein